jgi:hypothetical protein
MLTMNNPTVTETELVAKNKMYFTDRTEAAIIAYINSNDPEEREMLYRLEIGKALDKLAESIINRFKYSYIDANFEDMKRQVISHLMCNIHMFNADKGKAFSYLSVMAKNYLILENSKGYKQEKESVHLSPDNQDGAVAIEDVVFLEAPDEHRDDDAKEFVSLMIRYWENNIVRIFKKKRDIDIAKSIIQLFRDVDGLENFNKKALYVMIREMSDCETGYITKVINKMKDHIKRQLIEFYEYGTIDQYDSPYFSFDE